MVPANMAASGTGSPVFINDKTADGSRTDSEMCRLIACGLIMLCTIDTYSTYSPRSPAM